MKNLFKASLAVATSFAVVGMLTACGELDAYKPEKPKANPEEKVGLVLPDNLSEELAAVLIDSMQANQVSVFGDQVKGQEVELQGFVNTFDLIGKGVVEGISTQKVYRGNTHEDGMGADKYDISVQVFARSVSLNRELTFSSQLLGAENDKSSGFVELERAGAGDRITEYLDCIDEINPGFKAALKIKEAYSIKAFASCLDSKCDKVLVKLQLENRANAFADSRVGILFEDKVSAGDKTESPIDLNMVDSSIPDMLSFIDAESNKKEPEPVAQCVGVIDETPTAEEQQSATGDELANRLADEGLDLSPPADEPLGDSDIDEANMGRMDAYKEYAESRVEGERLANEAAQADGTVEVDQDLAKRLADEDLVMSLPVLPADRTDVGTTGDSTAGEMSDAVAEAIRQANEDVVDQED